MNTETFAKHRFEVIASRQSKIRPRETQETYIGLLCPRCGERCKPIEHGQSTVCGGCSLRMETWGNALICHVGAPMRALPGGKS